MVWNLSAWAHPTCTLLIVLVPIGYCFATYLQENFLSSESSFLRALGTVMLGFVVAYLFALVLVVGGSNIFE
jgi:hypothetical protein